MIWQQALMSVLGFGAGILVSAGVFTVLLAVGLVPRFAGRTNTGNKIFLYEEMIVLGTLAGDFLSVFPKYGQIGAWVRQQLLLGAHTVTVWKWIAGLAVSLFGLFAGIFVGCLALAIAEMLDSIPILTRRIGFRHGLGFLVLGLALGKLLGSLIYFAFHLYETGL
ncbi:MAG TPA: stage V sporulation protein AB [Candidatus Eisenbergiella merdigallinarum]|uniref:Stage V sporulation protein AB n=1 Tax=Candidatus Eisenbergiella merdigallinarum TaxID=2838552 RepID=A0A9D2MQ85_9FIRM|nr:stage V sporulation protein AB [Candidatus Eisenbergiella merdigallinarum]